MGLKLFRFLAAPWAPSQKKVSTFTRFGTKQWIPKPRWNCRQLLLHMFHLMYGCFFRTPWIEFYVRLILDSWEREWRHSTQWHWSQRQIRGDAQGSEWSRWRWEINQWGKEKNSGRLLREATRGGSPGSQICESVGALWGECPSRLIACKTNCWHDDLLHLTLLPPYLRDDLQGSHKT